ncbi:hypothetical protein O181_087077 [Austropuccinia psidii MF-1]|uniref:histone deacetylase n=1 Tax=Austropuccinia psidii MF-1 TaxID=1389203 RepID=A0A9Q3INZ8_9BASI|nr:hypothetical protein [Austropuccinia psidii MF-1]
MSGPSAPLHSRCVYALPDARHALDQLPSNLGRSSVVHSLVRSFDLLHSPRGRRGPSSSVNRAQPLITKLASRSDLEKFHDADYVDFLLKDYKEDDPDIQDQGDWNFDHENFSLNQVIHLDSTMQTNKRRKIEKNRESTVEHFGLEHDCPPFPRMAEYVLAVAGAVLEVSQKLRENQADIGIVWDGGRHHAQRSCAAGFCYVNDAALAILELRKQPTNSNLPRLQRVMYLDYLDIHHGDGVELAFWSTSFILTVSVHFHDPQGGFYPLSGSVDSSGPPPPSPAASHALNIPIEHPGSLSYICHRSLLPLINVYKPSAIVIQCGVDGLAEDPLGGRLWGFGLEEMGHCLEIVVQDSLAVGRKVLLLGGGGYHTANAARAWAYFTSIALGRKLDLTTEIPLNVERETDYGPGYTLDVPQFEKVIQEEMKPENDEKLQRVVQKIDHHILILKKRYG